MSSSFKDFREGNCEETEHVCASFCGISKQYAVAGILYSLFSALTVVLIGLCTLHLCYLIFIRPIALKNSHYVHLTAAMCTLLAGGLHLVLSGAIGLADARLGSGVACSWAAILTALCSGGHFLYLKRRGFHGLPRLKYTELGDTHLSMDAGRQTDIQIEVTEPPDDKKQYKKELEDLQNRLQTSEDIQKSLMNDNQSLTMQLTERDKAIKELEQKLLRTQNNVQVTAALAVAKQKEDEIAKLLNRLRDLDEGNSRLAKSGEELRARLRDREAAEVKLRTEQEAELQTLRKLLTEARTNADSQVNRGAEEERRKIESINAEKEKWNAEKMKLMEEAGNAKNKLGKENEELRNMIKNLQNALQESEKQLETAQKRAKETESGQITQLMEEIQKITSEKTQLKRDFDDSERKSQQINQELSSQIESFQREITGKSEEISKLQFQITELTDELAGVRSELNERNLHIADIRDKSQASSETLQGSVTQKDSEIAALNSQISHLTAEITQHKTSVSHKDSQISALQIQLTDLKTSLESQISSAETVQTELNSEVTKLQGIIKSKDKDLEKTIEKVVELTQQVDTLKHASGKKSTELEQENQVLKGQIEELKPLTESLQTTLDVKSMEIVNLQGKIKQLQQEKDASLAEMKTQQEQILSVNKQLSDSQNELKSLQIDRDSAAKSLENVKREKENLQQKLFEMISEHDSAVQKASDAETEITNLQAENKKLTVEIEKNKAELAEKESEIGKIAGKIQELTQQKNDATSKFLSLLNEHEDLKREKVDLEEALEALRSMAIQKS